jgi:hypothetical protein
MEQKSDGTVTYVSVSSGIPTNDVQHKGNNQGINDKISPIQYSTEKIHN